MDFLIDPNIAYLLLVTGFILAFLALFAPGSGILELAAIFALLAAGYGVFTLPVNLWAIALLLIGVVPFWLALRQSRRWLFLGLSLPPFLLGSAYLFRSSSAWIPGVNPLLALVVSALSVLPLWYITRQAFQVMQIKPQGSLDRLVGATGETRTTVFREGSVYVNGEMWSAISDEQIPAGSQIRVVSRRGFVVKIEPIVFGSTHHS